MRVIVISFHGFHIFSINFLNAVFSHWSSVNFVSSLLVQMIYL